ncbi:MAG: molybdopterin-guanine dinucleotide biosynthesis protein B [Gammaproteobacteria bacterium]|nr:molybdopterin-guanine dinucleotide biosynthesis protein B [Gammaproteobacteria bacterium]
MTQETPVIAFVGYSGSGKTTLIELLIPLLAAKGVRVAALKHSHHRFDIDHEGKDSYRLRKAGARQTIVASQTRWALIGETPNQTVPDLNTLLKKFDHGALDLILIEGFKHEHIPKIEVHRKAIDKPYFHIEDSDIFALATDQAISYNVVPDLLDINNPQEIADYITRKYSLTG